MTQAASTGRGGCTDATDASRGTTDPRPSDDQRSIHDGDERHAAHLPDGTPETPAHRQAACCQSEPECLLCPLRPENADRSLQQLWDAGLYAELPKLGFR